jgi:hypothetical protein
MFSASATTPVNAISAQIDFQTTAGTETFFSCVVGVSTTDCSSPPSTVGTPLQNSTVTITWQLSPSGTTTATGTITGPG